MHQAWWVHENDFLQYRLERNGSNIWDAKLKRLVYCITEVGMVPDMCANKEE